jgi:phosphoribosylformylglycinamidine synthase subunit PurL
VHDVSDGGLLVALAEMAMASGIGASLTLSPWKSESMAPHAYFFGEDQARYLVTTTTPDILVQGERATGAPVRLIGTTTADGCLALVDGTRISIADLRKASEGFFPALMG